MEKILLISYGGTIVMVVKDNVVQPAENVEEILKMVPRIKEIANIDFKVLSNIDSTNVASHDWTKLINFIAKTEKDYDGFIITHGTNTMSYTASALALGLGPGWKKPIVLTGSQLPLTEYGDDAKFNLENATKAVVEAVNQKVCEVMIVFSDLIIRGCRSVKISEDSFRAFASPAYDDIGKIGARGIFFNNYARRIRDNHPVFDPKPYFETGVLTVDLVPGQLPDLIDIVLKSGQCKGLILKSHGAGSVPNIGSFSFINLIKRSVEEYKVPVLVSTKFLGGNAYKEINDEPAVQAIEAGAIPTGDMTDVMAEVKLMWLLAQGSRSADALKKLIPQDFVGEITSF